MQTQVDWSAEGEALAWQSTQVKVEATHFLLPEHTHLVSSFDEVEPAGHSWHIFYLLYAKFGLHIHLFKFHYWLARHDT